MMMMMMGYTPETLLIMLTHGHLRSGGEGTSQMKETDFMTCLLRFPRGQTHELLLQLVQEIHHNFRIGYGG